MHTGFLWENLRERDCSEDLGINWRITVKWTFKKWDGEAWMGLVWPRIGTGRGLLLMQ